MSAVIMDGKALAEKVKAVVKENTRKCLKSPRLAVIVTGNNPASAVYVKNKMRDCEEVGIKCEIYNLNGNVTNNAVEEVINTLNGRIEVDGIICQLPLADGLDEDYLLSQIDHNKDVDGFYSDEFDPCTPLGIVLLLEEYGIEIAGKHCVIVGRSDIVGKPLARMLVDMDATVTLCHSKTNNLAEFTKSADILIVAVGKRDLITADMVKDGVVVIDVGINRTEDGKLCGDVDFNSVVEKASYITPVPGGVGPMTRAMLLENVVKANILNKF